MLTRCKKRIESRDGN